MKKVCGFGGLQRQFREVEEHLNRHGRGVSQLSTLLLVYNRQHEAAVRRIRSSLPEAEEDPVDECRLVETELVLNQLYACWVKQNICQALSRVRDLTDYVAIFRAHSF